MTERTLGSHSANHPARSPPSNEADFRFALAPCARIQRAGRLALARWSGSRRRRTRAEPSGGIVSEPRRYPRNARSAPEIHGFCAAVPVVRIHLPPAESPRLAGFCPPTARSRLFARVCGPGRCSAISNGRRQCSTGPGLMPNLGPPNPALYQRRRRLAEFRAHVSFFGPDR